MTARILLHKDRRKEGTIVFDCGKTFRCLGRSDQASADAAGNPTRSPLHKLGDLPTGTYHAVRQNEKPRTPENIRSYGRGPTWYMNPTAGDALIAHHNGRDGILLHAGATGAPMPKDALRPTHGCARTVTECIDWLFQDKMTESAQFDITVEEID